MAFIGVGDLAATYLDSLESVDEADVTAVCDIDEDRANEVADQQDAVAYTNHGTMFDEAAFDAVIVTIPPFAHTDQEIMAAERGIDLFVAKPIALSNEQAAEIGAEIVASGIVNQVEYMWRYADVADRAQEILESREIGLIDGRVWVEAPDLDWWYRKELSGGQIVEQATHVYDLVRYLGGEVASVSGVGANRLGVEGIDFEDLTSVTMAHENDIVSHVSTTCGAPGHQYDVHVVAEDVRLHLQCLESELTGVVDGEEIRYRGERDGYTRQLAAFVAACRDGDECRVWSTYADAAETLELTLAATEAAEEGTTVPLS